VYDLDVAKRPYYPLQVLKSEVRYLVRLVVFLAGLPAMLPVEPLVRAVYYEVPAYLQDPEPLVYDVPRLMGVEVLQQVRGIDVVERLVPEPAEVPCVSARFSGAVPTVLYGRGTSTVIADGTIGSPP